MKPNKPFQRPAIRPARPAGAAEEGMVGAPDAMGPGAPTPTPTNTNPIAVLFESISAPVGRWMELSVSDRNDKALQLIRERRTTFGDSAIVRRVMDAYALAYETARTALS